MRTSNKILTVIAVLVLLAGSAMIIGVRIISNNYMEKNAISLDERKFSEDQWGTVEYDIKNFKRVRLLGGLRVELSRGDEYRVALHIPEPLREHLEVRKEGDELVLDASQIVSFNNRRFTAVISLPNLEELKSSGGLDIDMRGFEGDALAIESSGALDMIAVDCLFENLYLQASGGVNMDLKGMPVVNAEVRGSGATNLVLTIKGGRLDGKISGAANIEYYGTVSENTLSVSGVSNVEHKGR